MKKYIVFICSCIVLYIPLQLLSGWILTAFFVPDISSAINKASHEASFGQTSIIPFLTTLSIATLAYFFSQHLSITNKKNPVK
ncbi:hypothetical protein [Planomicrobium soli]|uniref:hypothetical protein n=1 Tax=Planomicrobium soli TaxID=1176648 RepID=UPI000D0DB11C|nr:hypothetical protein [Planomicrobium soli]